MTPPSPQPPGVRISRWFAHSAEKVFASFVEPEALVRWFAPDDAHRVTEATVDAVPGGRYRITMVSSAGDIFVLVGVYREVVAPTRLVFTWSWERGMEDIESTVRIELTPERGGTLLDLTHGPFGGEEAEEAYRRGWQGALGHLDTLFTQEIS